MMTAQNSLVGQLCVVVGGAGAVGRMFVDHLQHSGAEISVIDVAAHRSDRFGDRARYEQGDITNISPRVENELRRANLVLLAIPEKVALAAIKHIIEVLQPGALVVDTLSVKGPIVDVVATATADIEMISLNPMFAPSLGLKGRPVAAVVVYDGPRVRQLLQLIDSWGGRIVMVTKEQHDRLAGATQALTHAAVLAFGFALAALDADIFELSAVAPPPHITMLALLARISSAPPETYWDVQSSNPQASLARMTFANGLRRFAELVEDRDKNGFVAAIHRLRGFLGRDLEYYNNICAQIFESIGNAGRYEGNRDSD